MVKLRNLVNKISIILHLKAQLEMNVESKCYKNLLPQ